VFFFVKKRIKKFIHGKIYSVTKVMELDLYDIGLLLHQLNLATSLRSFCRNSSSAPPYAPLGARRRFLDLRQKSLQICWQVLIGGAIIAIKAAAAKVLARKCAPACCRRFWL